jgi:hypothetical protein
LFEKNAFKFNWPIGWSVDTKWQIFSLNKNFIEKTVAKLWPEKTKLLQNGELKDNADSKLQFVKTTPSLLLLSKVA